MGISKDRRGCHIWSFRKFDETARELTQTAQSRAVCDPLAAATASMFPFILAKHLDPTDFRDVSYGMTSVDIRTSR